MLADQFSRKEGPYEPGLRQAHGYCQLPIMERAMLY